VPGIGVSGTSLFLFGFGWGLREGQIPKGHFVEEQAAANPFALADNSVCSIEVLFPTIVWPRPFRSSSNDRLVEQNSSRPVRPPEA